MTPRVKICGITTPDLALSAAKAGADMIGLVHFAPSPRHLPLEAMALISEATPEGITRVALTVDADDATLAAIVEAAPDIIQLHGRETPDRARAIADRHGIAVLKAIGVAGAADVARAGAYGCDILFDAKPPKDATRPGGLGTAFDWSLLPQDGNFMLSGGLTPTTVAAAVTATRPNAVDVSSGVETDGAKDPAKMAAFVRAVRTAGITVERIDPESPIATAALSRYYGELAARFEGGFDVTLSRDPDRAALAPPHGAFLVATRDGAPIGCVALKGGDTPEVKRLWVAPEARGLGLATRLMAALEAEAAALGLTHLRLDTNNALPEAAALYARLGWREIERFNTDPYAHRFFEKRLTAAHNQPA
ncbi:MAG: phosphoribosylanthranilate isomerase [Pseudomonadota bacterium]